MLPFSSCVVFGQLLKLSVSPLGCKVEIRTVTSQGGQRVKWRVQSTSPVPGTPGQCLLLISLITLTAITVAC